jgi:hypothetical protein
MQKLAIFLAKQPNPSITDERNGVSEHFIVGKDGLFLLSQEI